MANSKISALTAASALVGTEAIPVVQGGVTLKLTPAQIKAFVSAGGTVVTSNPVLDLTQTWNSGGVAFTGMKFNVTDTASAAGSLLMDLQVGGVSKFNVRKDGTITGLGAATFGSEAAGVVPLAGLTIYNSGYLGWASSGSSLGTIDTKLYRDAANNLALRNGTAAQAFNVYNTYTDASNYERGYARWNAGVYEFGMEALGTGWPKHVRLNRATGANLYLGDWKVNSSGHFLASVDNTFDIGASGANRPRVGYFGTRIQTPTWNLDGAGYITSVSDGVLDITNNASTNSVRFTVGAANLLTLNGGLKTTGATFALQTATTLTDNAAAQVATMTNGPAAGNPTKWIAINDNGVTRYIPAW